MSRRLLIALFLACGWAPSANANDLVNCANAERAPKAAVPACSRLLNSGGLTARNREVALNKRGVGHLLTGKFDSAIADWTEAIKLNPSNPVYYNNRGYAHANARRFDAAKTDYTRSVEADRGYWMAYHNRGAVHFHLGRHEQAATDFEMAARLEPNSSTVHADLGAALTKLGKLHEAIAAHTRAIALEPQFANAYHGRGYALYLQGRVTEAIADYDYAVPLAPRNVVLLNDRGIALHQIAEYDKALADYDAAIALEPNSALAHFNRATTLLALDKFDNAVTAFQTSLKFDPSRTAEMHNNLCWDMATLQRLEDALAECEKALQLSPDNPGILDSRAFVFWQMGRVAEAQSDLAWAHSISSKRPLYVQRLPNFKVAAIQGLLHLNEQSPGRRDGIPNQATMKAIKSLNTIHMDTRLEDDTLRRLVNSVNPLLLDIK